MRPRRRSYPWASMLDIDVSGSRAGEPVRDLADAPGASTVLAVFSGVMWAIAIGLLFFDPRAGAAAGLVATVLVWQAARRA